MWHTILDRLYTSRILSPSFEIVWSYLIKLNILSAVIIKKLLSWTYTNRPSNHLFIFSFPANWRGRRSRVHQFRWNARQNSNSFRRRVGAWPLIYETIKKNLAPTTTKACSSTTSTVCYIRDLRLPLLVCLPGGRLTCIQNVWLHKFGWSHSYDVNNKYDKFSTKLHSSHETDW